MSYTLDQYVFRGLSSDTKPSTDPAGRGTLPVGSRFVEVDTGSLYDWNGSAWVAALYGTASNAYTSAPTVTRPANTTPYAAGDVVGATAAAITFPSAGPSGGHVLVTTDNLRIDLAAVPSGMTSFRLYLYNVTPPSALADNAVWDLSSGDRAGFLGYLDLGTPVDLGSTLFVQTINPGLQVKLATGSTSLFGYLVTAAIYTPTSGEVYTPRLETVGV